MFATLKYRNVRCLITLDVLFFNGLKTFKDLIFILYL